MRARATCIEGGVVRTGQSSFVGTPANVSVSVPKITLGEAVLVPEFINISGPGTPLASGDTFQVSVSARFPGNITGDVSQSTDGTSFTTSNASIATVGENGLITAVGPGTAIISSRNDGTLSTIFVNVGGGADSDGDGIPDDYEVANGLDPNNPNDGSLDPDGDGLTNIQEFQFGTLAQVADTDGDGLNDGGEIAANTNPFNPDTDGDGLFDGPEIDIGSNPLVTDSDGDSLNDGIEVALGLSPTDPDSDNDGTSDFNEDTDGDGLSNGAEVGILTDPANPDTDGDGFQDGFEVASGCNPIIEELTAVAGRTVDNQLNSIADAFIRVLGQEGITGISGSQGNFNISTAQACPPQLQVSATGQLGGTTFNGLSSTVFAVVNGTTNVGDVVMEPILGVPYFFLKIPVGSSPKAVAVGDFNLDGALDFVTANGSSSGDLSVLLGNGDGTFQAEQVILTGDFPTFVAVDDVNLDGLPDIVATVTNGIAFFGEIFVYLGNGNGTFTFSDSQVIGNLPNQIAIGNINNDAFPDIVIVEFFENEISILFGNGNGTFQPRLTLPVGSQPMSAVTGDLDGDGFDDVVVSSTGDVTVYISNGDNTFQPVHQFFSSGTNDSVALGDVDGDTLLDIMVGTGVGYAVIKGNGNGTFQTPIVTTARSGDRELTLEDFNNDGILDFVQVNNFVDDMRSFLGNGDGTFTLFRFKRTGDNPNYSTSGDFNNDGIPDVAVSNNNDDTVSIFTGLGNGSFDDPRRRFVAGNTQTQSTRLADLNGDGKLDIVVANGNESTLGGDVSALLGNGNGVFQARQVFTAGDAPRSVAVGDFNLDTIPDIAVANRFSDNVSVLLGNGNGTLQPALQIPAGNGPEAVAIADINEDGTPDLIVTNRSSNNLTRIAGNGDGTFGTPITIGDGGIGLPEQVDIADFNNDNLLDLAIVGNDLSGRVAIRLGNADETFQIGVRSVVGRRPLSLASGDINLDGNRDIVVSNNLDDDISVLFGNGDGTFQPQQRFPVGAAPQEVIVHDLNGDSFLDIAVANEGTVDVSIYIGNGDGTFRPEQRFVAGNQSPRSLDVGDVNNDGDPDIVVGDRGDDRVFILIHR